MRKNRKVNTVYLVQMALLIAIILIMAFTPIGYIRTLGVDITLIVVPVAVGAVVLGPMAGTVLGAVFGLTSFIQCFGMSPFGAVLLGINPIYTFIVCFVTRTIVGGLTGLIYQGLFKLKATRKLSVVITNLCCPLLNTVLVMGTLVLFFYQTSYIQGFADTLGVGNPVTFIVAFVGINGVIEATVCFVVGSAISHALKKVVQNTIPEDK
ncbi:MAG: ECF transporter S component [Lachnospiraceae bacterium]